MRLFLIIFQLVCFHLSLSSNLGRLAIITTASGCILMGRFIKVVGYPKSSLIRLRPVNQKKILRSRQPFSNKENNNNSALLRNLERTSASKELNEYFTAAGRKYLMVPSRLSQTNSNKNNVPLVILGGMAQTIGSWEHHLYPLSRDRDVLIYECHGQGLGDQRGDHRDAAEHNQIKDIDFKDVSLEFQANDFVRVVKEVFPSCQLFDVAGFSFGGRVALAVAATHPKIIRKIHLTGVCAERDEYADIVLSSWEDMLSICAQPNAEDKTILIPNKDGLVAFAWSIIMTTYSPKFLASNGNERVRKWVKQICTCNSPEGLLALLQQTNKVVDEHDEWSPLSMAQRILLSKKEELSNIEGKICIGSNDKISTPISAQRLSDYLEWGEISIFSDSGHAVPMESARAWRNNLIKFLDDETCKS